MLCLDYQDLSELVNDEVHETADPTIGVQAFPRLKIWRYNQGTYTLRSSKYFLKTWCSAATSYVGRQEQALKEETDGRDLTTESTSYLYRLLSPNDPATFVS